MLKNKYKYDNYILFEKNMPRCVKYNIRQRGKPEVRSRDALKVVAKSRGPIERPAAAAAVIMDR